MDKKNISVAKQLRFEIPAAIAMTFVFAICVFALIESYESKNILPTIVLYCTVIVFPCLVGIKVKKWMMKPFQEEEKETKNENQL